MKTKLFKKSLAFILALAVIVSAMSCLLLVPVAAEPDYSKLTATYDFNNGSAADFVQVGGKTGNETAEGYNEESGNVWNYDPEVGSASGFEKYTISAHEIDYADESTVKLVTSNALIAKPYLNVITSGTTRDNIYLASNTITSDTNYSKETTQAGNTSFYTLASTVDENGVAIEGLSKKKISGRFTFDYNEIYTTNSVANSAITYSGSSPVIAYYFKDANNWRGIKMNSHTWHDPYGKKMGMLTYQHILVEEGETTVYNRQGNGTAFTGGTQILSPNSAQNTYKDHVLNPDNEAFTCYVNTVFNTTKTTTNANGRYPVFNSNEAAEEYRFCEWLNFELIYEDSYIIFNISDANGFATQITIRGASNVAAYDTTGATITTSTLDVNGGTFALGSSFSVGTDGFSNTTQPTGNAFDDIKVEMGCTGEAAVGNAVSAISAIADEDTFNAAKTAYNALSAEQKARVSNAALYKKWEGYYTSKRITADFNQDWQRDLFKLERISASSEYFFHKDVINQADSYRSDISADTTGNKLLTVSMNIASNATGRNPLHVNLPSAMMNDIESVTYDMVGGLYDENVTWATGNGALTLSILGSSYTITNNNNSHKILKNYQTTATSEQGILSKTTAWNTAVGKTFYVDLFDDFTVTLTKNSASSTTVTFKGTQMVDEDGDGVYVQGANTQYEESFTVAAAIDKISLFTGYYVTYDIDNVDIKFTGWEDMVGLTAEEEELAARIVAIPEITINNYTTVNTEVSAIRAAVDALATTGLAAKMPEGSESTYLELLAAAEAEIATFTGDVATAQEFVDDNNTVLNIATSNVNESNAQSIIDVHTAYEALTDAVKSILANNYAMLDNDATGEKCFDIIANLKENYAIAIPLCPTEAQLAFLAHYEQNGIGALTAAEDSLAVLEESIVLYKAVEETHKPNVQTKYEHILDLLNKYFINGNKFTYTKSDVAAYPNIYEYLTGTIFTQSTTASDENRTKANMVLNPDLFDGTSTNSFKVAMNFGVGGSRNHGFNLLPNVAVQNLGAGTITPSNYLYTFLTQSKSNIYSGGVNVGSGSIYVPIFDGSFKNSNPTGWQFFKGGSTTFIGTNAYYTGDYTTESSTYILDAEEGYYRLPYDRIVYDCEYTVSLDTNYAAANGETYNRVTITYEKLTVWFEKADDTTPYVYDESEGSTDLYVDNNKGGMLCYAYSEDEIALPQFYTDITSIGNTQYLEIGRETTLTEEYEDILDNTYTEEDADEVIELAKVYNAMSSSDKAINAELTAKIEEAIDNAGLRPVSMGSTLSVGANTSIGFKAGKPAVENYDKFGIILATFNTMNTKGDKELTLSDVSSTYAKNFAMEYEDGDTRPAELTFNVHGLFDEESSGEATEGSTVNSKWGVWLVARYYAVYTAADGITEVVIYSTNDFGNTPTSSKTDETEAAAENEMLQAIAANGQLIRSVNGNIKLMATELFAAKDTYATDVGVDYVDGYGATQSNYTGVTLEAAYGDDDNGLLDTAEETLYLMKAFRGVFTKMAAANS